MTHALLELADRRTVIFDGAMGTMLMAAGLPAGENPVTWNLDNGELVGGIHRQYYEAGSDAVHTNTFLGNPLKLHQSGLLEKTALLNEEAAKIARKVCPEGKFVAGDMGPTGQFMKPLGELSPEEAEESYFRQAEALLTGGVDFISIETMFSLEEALSALRGAKRLGDILVIAAMTYNRTKKGFFTMMGEGVAQCVAALEEAGADVIGSNCTLGSADMIDLTKEITAVAQKPVLIQPNAGQPVTRKGITSYEQHPAEFAEHGKAIREAGAQMIGGCCGTNADFIRELVKALHDSSK
jgi:5-methyltetrahydrofolate--homocysteine methyltransferase